VAVLLVLAVVALEVDDLAVALEGQDVGRDPVEEPAVVADHDGTTGEVAQIASSRARSVFDVEVVGRFVEEQQVAAAFQQRTGQVDPVRVRRPRGSPTRFCWSVPLEVEGRPRRPGPFTVALPSSITS
jgi:hypothetical protein